MTFLLTTWRTAMERYRDEGEWMEPCTPTESGLMTALAAFLYLTPVVAFLYFLFF